MEITSAIRRFGQSLGKFVARLGVFLLLGGILRVIVRLAGATSQQTQENQSDYGFHRFSLLSLNSAEPGKNQTDEIALGLFLELL